MRYHFEDCTLDTDRRELRRPDGPVSLEPQVFDLLEFLVRHRGRVVSREMLAREVWKETSRATPIDNVIDVHVARLRRKVDDPFTRKLVHTVRGVGFTVREDE